MAVAKVTKKRYEKEGGVKKGPKKQKNRYVMYR